MRKDIKNQATSNPVKLDTEPDVAEEEVMEEKLSATKKSIESQKKSTMSLLQQQMIRAMLHARELKADRKSTRLNSSH